MNGTAPVFPASTTTGIAYRDWLAALAMQGILTKGLKVSADRALSDDERDEAVATQAYRIADAMLRIGSKTRPNNDRPRPDKNLPRSEKDLPRPRPVSNR